MSADIDINYRNRLRKKRIPITIMFELTYRCNLDCVHCYIRIEDNEHRKRELDFDRICGILEQMAEAGVIYLGFTGGEPLLRPDFKDIYLFAKKKKLAVSILTNATLLTEDMIDFFEEYPPLMIEVSNYGLSEQTYEDITRVKGSFECFQKAMDILNKSKVRFIVKFVIMKSNLEEAIRNIHIVRKNCGCVPMVLRKDREAIKNAIISGQRLSPEEVVLFFKNLGRGFKDVCSEHRFADMCNAETLSCVITPDGKLTICEYMDEPSVDLKKVRFIDAWRSYKIDKTPMMKQEIACGDCEFKVRCMWCPGVAYIETGSTEKKVPYLCGIMKALKENQIYSNKEQERCLYA